MPRRSRWALSQVSARSVKAEIARRTQEEAPKAKAGGGSYGKLFDGTEKLLSWDNILWINRGVMLP